METYEEMLAKVYEKLPEKKGEGERFEMPKFRSFIEGKTTVITNFKDVVSTLRRDPQHLLKFLNRELATPAHYDGRRAILQGRFKEEQLNARLTAYVKEYVLCKECRKPDTELIVFEGVKYKRCEACGARAPVKPL